jgi:hypothetical protein
MNGRLNKSSEKMGNGKMGVGGNFEYFRFQRGLKFERNFNVRAMNFVGD